ncbi:hypothetical protein B0J17DRAFT_771000 [Rhizoctonia solani]|nr:hypothetical protein B0J17DRAFT_771000 [Rhizoctonia solani]
MHINNLPLEVIHAILSVVPRQSLGPASLVCKGWRSAALSILFRSVRLFSEIDNPNLEGLAESSWTRFNNRPGDLLSRIIHETNDAGLGFQFSSCVRRLWVGWNMGEEQLRTFGSAVSKMKHLQHITWVVSPIYNTEWHDTLTRLNTELNLRSLDLVVAQKDIPLGESGEIISLDNLKELAIEFDENIDEEPNWEMPTTIVNLVCGARNIESLSLDLELDSSLVEWGPNDIFSALSSHLFPHLRKLYIGSCSRQTSLECFTRPGSGLRQLLGRQRLLHKVLLYICQYSTVVGEDYSVSPHDLEETLPSIRHFGGPVLMVEALIKSRLASQVEVLEIIQLNNIQHSNLVDLLQKLDSPAMNELSNLKGLAISTYGGGFNDANHMICLLAKLLFKMPVLEELVISESLLEVLTQLPHLRWLAFAEWWLTLLDKLPGTQTFSERAKALHPRLSIVSSVEFSPFLS